MNFKEAMLELARDSSSIVMVTPKDETRPVYEVAIRYCNKLGYDVLMNRFVSTHGYSSKWVPISYLFCNEKIIDGMWEVKK